jgi:O-antigen/teichoic acid export membrane protein
VVASLTGARDPVSLKQRALRAGGWTALGWGLSNGMRLLSTLVMTRLLVPEMFGVMTIATMVSVIIALLTDLGIKQNIIQSAQGTRPEFLDTAWTLQIGRGVALWALGVLLAAGLHWAASLGFVPRDTVYAAPVLPWIIAAVSFTAVIAGLQSTKMALAERALEQHLLIRIELIAQAASLVVMVALGWATRSIWALVAGSWTSVLVSAALSHAWLPGPRNRLRWEAQSVQEMVGFGKWIFVSSFVGVFALNADRIVLGGLVSPHTLGQYTIAATIVGTVAGIFGKVYSTVAMPALSETARRDRGRLREVFYRLRVPTDVALLLIAGLLAGCGQVVIDVLYDHRYHDAGRMVQILAVSLVWTRLMPSQHLYLALARPAYVAATNGVRFVAVFAALALGFHLGGMEGALWGFSLHQAVVAVLVHRYNSRLGIHDGWREYGVLVLMPLGYGVGRLLEHLLR